MTRVLILSATAFALTGSLAVFAQNAPPTYQGDPEVYKVIFEDQNFRVIATTRKKGVHDKSHGHPLPSVVYNITDCTTKTYAPDGKTSEIVRKAGTANAVPVIPSHSAENTGAADCEQIFVEPQNVASPRRSITARRSDVVTTAPRLTPFPKRKISHHIPPALPWKPLPGCCRVTHVRRRRAIHQLPRQLSSFSHP
jgi:hypothetical protein